MGVQRRWPLTCLVVFLSLFGTALSDDGATLTSLKGILSGSSSVLSTWTSSSFYCTWQGVFCADTSVYKLDLSNQGLSGSIVDVINTVSKLQGLQYLYLNGNQLAGGPIPDSLGGMTALLGIHLQKNQITGGLPDVFTRLTSITEILISDNPLGGTLPSSLQSLNGLQTFDMSSTQLTGTIPTWMSSFPQLRLLYLGTNNLTGSLPPLTGLSSLMELYVNINQLTGSIPSSIGGLKTLVKLYLDRNAFSGPIPPSLGSLSSLKSLYLDNTQVSGTIPQELTKLLPTTTALDLRYTNLVGTVPVGLLSNAIVCDGYAPWGWPAGSGPACIFSGNPSLVCPTGSTCPSVTTPSSPATPAPTPIATPTVAPAVPMSNTTSLSANTPPPLLTPPQNATATAPPPVQNTSLAGSTPGQNSTLTAPAPQNAGLNTSTPPGQNSTVISPAPLSGQNTSVNSFTPGQNSTVVAPSPLSGFGQNASVNSSAPGQNSTVNAPSPLSGQSPSVNSSSPGQNSTLIAPSPLTGPSTVVTDPAPGQNSTVAAPAPLPGLSTNVNSSTSGQNSTMIAPSALPGQNTSVNGSTPGQNSTVIVPLPGQNVTAPAPSLAPTNLSTPAPEAPGANQTVPDATASNVCTCPVNQTAGLGSVAGRCNCVYGLGASYRFVDRNLVDWTADFQTNFLNALAGQLQIQPFQIMLGRAAQGSILLDTSVVPLVGNTFEIWTANGMEDVLGGRNGKSLQLNETQFGRVLVTSVTPPALLGPSTPGSAVPNSASSSGSSGSNLGGIIGGIVGGIAGLLLIAGAIWAAIVISKRRRRSSHSQSHSMLVPAGGPSVNDPSFATLPSKSISVSVDSNQQFFPPQYTASPTLPPSPGGANAILASPWRSSNSPVPSDSGSYPVRISPRKSSSSPDSDGERGVRNSDSGYGGGRDSVSRTQRLLSLRESTEVLPPWREFTAEELRAATGNFARENVLGSGLFGTVYKAQLADGRTAAVKRAEIAPSVLESRQAEFQRELETLSQLRHRHLVPFLGFCEVASRELMLVYDYMPNGTLQDNLPGGVRGILDWPARVRVAVEVASAIEYLHNGCRPPIVHRDIKSNNILLDENDSAYLGDFGLATLYDAERTHITTAIKGTPGYLDPQYFATQELTQRSDVYSFGVLLLSIVTGKKAIFSVLELDPSDPDRARLQRQAVGKVNLSTWAVPLIREGRMSTLVDGTIEEAERYMHDIEIVAEVAAECVQDRSQDRPEMSEVLVRLRGVLALVQQ